MPADEDTSPEDEDRPLSPAETRRALITAAIAWGVFGSAWASMISGAPFVTFAREKLGASTFMFGLLCSVPFLGVIAQLPSAYWVERTRRRRLLFLIAGTGQRLIWFAVAALPWVIPAAQPELRVWAFLGLVLIGSSLGQAGAPAWLSWLADMVPENIRGRYLGNRAALATTTAVLVSAVVAYVIDRSSTFTTFTIIFSVAALVGLGDIELFWTIREPPMPPHEGPPWRLRDIILAPLRNLPFRGYLLYALSESFMFGIAGPFFWLIGLEFLDIGNLWSNVYVMLIPMIFTAVGLPFWGRMCDRFGSRPLVTLGTVMSIIFPVCWVLATPSRYHTLLATASIVGGFFGAAIQVGDMNMLFALTPRRTRSAYLAAIALAASLGWAIAPALSGALAQALKPMTFHALGLTFRNLHLLMLLSILGRSLHIALIIPRLPEASPHPTRDLVAYLVLAPYRLAARAFTQGRSGRP